MEEKSPINNFRAPICKIHQSELNLLDHVCIRYDCINNFRPACSECLNEANIHKHNVIGNYYKPTLRALQDFEKLITADIP